MNIEGNQLQTPQKMEITFGVHVLHSLMDDDVRFAIVGSLRITFFILRN